MGPLVLPSKQQFGLRDEPSWNPPSGVVINDLLGLSLGLTGPPAPQRVRASQVPSPIHTPKQKTLKGHQEFISIDESMAYHVQN